MKHFYIQFSLLIFLLSLSGTLLGQTATVVNPSTSTSSDGSITVSWKYAFYLGSYVHIKGKDVDKNVFFTSTGQVVFSNLGVGVYVLKYYSFWGLVNNGSKTVTLTAECLSTVVCKDITVELDDTGSASITVEDIDDGSDICDSATSSVSPMAFNCDYIGPNEVTLTVTDNNDQISTCTSIVTVKDEIAPTANCQNITVELDENGDAIIEPEDIDNESTDNCGIKSMSLSKTEFSCNDISSSLVVESTTGYSVSINVWPISVNPDRDPCVDGYNYTVTLGYDISFSGSSAPKSLWTLQGTLGCGGSFKLPNNGGKGKSKTANAWRGVSDCATITPDILGCTEASIQIKGPGIPNQYIPLTFSGATTVLTVVDNSGNTSTCTANVTVVDLIAPTITNSPSNILECVTDEVNQTAIIEGIALDPDYYSDNCTVFDDLTVQYQIKNGTDILFDFGTQATGSESTSDPSGFAFPVGENTVTYKVIDKSGNESAQKSFTVKVNPNPSPIGIFFDE